MSRRLVAAFLLIVNGLSSRSAWAAWSHDPQINLPVYVGAGNQIVPHTVADGAGGVVIAWQDFRPGADWCTYAQHVVASGNLDPAWPPGGRFLANIAGSLVAVPDDAGGAIFVLPDLPYPHLYVRHLLADGTLDPSWPTGGRVLVEPPTAGAWAGTSDGAGGILVVWKDSRSGIYGQHVLSNGALAPGWPVTGRALCPGAHPYDVPTIVADGAGGAIFTWHDDRSSDAHIYAQRLSATGDPVWATNGMLVCGAQNFQYFPTVVMDDADGTYIAWEDFRAGNYDIYAQHVLGSGIADPAWPANGAPVTTSTYHDEALTLVSDLRGGAIVCWESRRCCSVDPYVGHLLPSGVDTSWPVDGLRISSSEFDDLNPLIESDGAGGAIVYWDDHRSGASDVYAQHVLPEGVLDARWPTDGRAIANAVNDQWSFAAVPDGRGGLVAAFSDYRDPQNPDIYGQRIGPSGDLGIPEPQWVHLGDVPDDRGGAVSLVWSASDREQDPAHPVVRYLVLRESPTGWDSVAAVFAVGTGQYSCQASTEQDSSAAGAAQTAFKVSACTANGSMWESVVAKTHSVDNGATTAVAESDSRPDFLDPPMPSPSSSRVTLLYGISERSRSACLRIFDASGRIVRSFPVPGGNRGIRTLSWDLRDERGDLARSGLYFVRLETTEGVRSRRIVVVR